MVNVGVIWLTPLVPTLAMIAAQNMNIMWRGGSWLCMIGLSADPTGSPAVYLLSLHHSSP